MKSWHLPFLAVFVVLLRLPYFNNPAIHIDEQFYLVFADKWINGGLLPYVDIWDRKPIGIFAIYAIAILAFKNAIVGYQIIATLFVIATCGVILRMGRYVGDGHVAFFSAAIYAMAVMLMEGQGGQTPIFYNLLVALAVTIILKLISRASSLPSRFVAINSLAACLLFGLALQIKYTCVVEAIALSLYLISVLHRRGDMRGSGLLLLALGMMVCGLVPTLFVGGIYAAIGHWHEFFAANFSSIFSKLLWRLSPIEFGQRFVLSSLFATFFLPFAGLGFWSAVTNQYSRNHAVALRAIVIWILAAFAGALMLGNPVRHYFLSTLVPLSLLVGVGFVHLAKQNNLLGRRAFLLQGKMHGYGGLIAVLFIPLIASFVIYYGNAMQRGEPDDVYAVGRYLKTHKTQGCPFIFNRLPILYYLGDMCAPSIYVFPNHLSEIGEVRTPGHERLDELARVLAAKPPMIFVRRPHTADTDEEAIGMLERALQDNYYLAMQRPGYNQFYDIYALKEAPSPSSP